MTLARAGQWSAYKPNWSGFKRKHEEGLIRNSKYRKFQGGFLYRGAEEEDQFMQRKLGQERFFLKMGDTSITAYFYVDESNPVEKGKCDDTEDSGEFQDCL